MTDSEPIRPQPLGPTDRGRLWAWICREIAAGRLPPDTTPDNLPPEDPTTQAPNAEP